MADFVELLLVRVDGLLEVLDLLLMIGSLLFAAVRIEVFRFLGLELFMLFVTKHSVNVGGGIESFAVAVGSHNADLSSVGPTSKGRPRDCISQLQNVRRRQVGGNGIVVVGRHGVCRYSKERIKTSARVPLLYAHC